MCVFIFQRFSENQTGCLLIWRQEERSRTKGRTMTEGDKWRRGKWESKEEFSWGEEVHNEVLVSIVVNCRAALRSLNPPLSFCRLSSQSMEVQTLMGFFNADAAGESQEASNYTMGFSQYQRKLRRENQLRACEPVLLYLCLKKLRWCN